MAATESYLLSTHDALVSASATSSSYVAVYNVPAGAGISIFPTIAGSPSSATVKSSISPLADCLADVLAGTYDGILAGGNAEWTEWAHGSVSDKSNAETNWAQTAIVVQPASGGGTWKVEVAQ